MFDVNDAQVHEILLNEVMTNPTTGKDFAAKNEIEKLRARIAELEKEAQPKKTTTRKASAK